MEPQKWDRNHHFPQSAWKAVALYVSCSNGKSFTEDAAQLFTNFVSSVSTLPPSYHFQLGLQPDQGMISSIITSSLFGFFG